jgi:hypothetical protein
VSTAWIPLTEGELYVPSWGRGDDLGAWRRGWWGSDVPWFRDCLGVILWDAHADSVCRQSVPLFPTR